MGKKFRCISHIERMLNKELHNKCKKDLVSDHYCYVEEYEMDNDRAIKVMKKRKIDPRKNFDKLKVSDFYLENLQACGAIQGLKPVSLDGDVIANIDNAVNSLAYIDSLE